MRLAPEASGRRHTRTEIRLPLGRAVRRVPAELADLVRARVRALPLQPVATVTTRRKVTTLVDTAGKSLAEIADDTVSGTRHDDPASASHWRELEVELTGGDGRLLQRPTRCCAAADCVRPGIQRSWSGYSAAGCTPGGQAAPVAILVREPGRRRLSRQACRGACLA